MNDDIPLSWLLGLLVFLVLLSAFFAASETGLMALNRYRLQYLAKQRHRGASKAYTLLKKPEHLLSLILLAEKSLTLFIASLATLIALKLWGEIGVAIAIGTLTLIIVVFVEIVPKTLATLNPEKIAFPAAHIYLPLLRLFFPLLWMVNFMTKLPLKLFKGNPRLSANILGREELRTLMAETNPVMPPRYHQMVLSIMDLESATVEDIMTPRNDIAGIDLDSSFEDIIKQIQQSAHTRLPVYKKTIDRVIGFLDLRALVALINQTDFDKQAIIDSLLKPVFIPKSTPLHKQMHTFKTDKERIGLVVDEYGDVKGLVTLDDLLQEIIGELMFDDADVKQHGDGSTTVDAGVTVREFNRITHSTLPTEGPKTINGLIVEYMETIPEPGTSVNLYGYHLEIIERDENTIKQVRFHPKPP